MMKLLSQTFGFGGYSINRVFFFFFFFFVFFKLNSGIYEAPLILIQNEMLNKGSSSTFATNRLGREF